MFAADTAPRLSLVTPVENAVRRPLICLMSSLPLLAAAAPPASPALARLRLEHEGAEVLYPAAKAQALAAPPVWLKALEAAGVYASAPLRLAPGGGAGPLVLACDSGPSADPSCYLLRDADHPEVRVFEAPGTRFEFRGDGRILVSGHSDNLYDHRRLFTYDGQRFVETPQPLRYVGVEARARADIPLRAERGGAGVVTLTLPTGAAFTVLLNDNARVDERGENADYLVLTPEGIVGWARLPARADGSTDAEGLYFRGD